MDKFFNRSKRNNPEFDSTNTERKPKHRKYDESYMDYGFSVVLWRSARGRCLLWLWGTVIK